MAFLEPGPLPLETAFMLLNCRAGPTGYMALRPARNRVMLVLPFNTASTSGLKHAVPSQPLLAVVEKNEG